MEQIAQDARIAVRGLRRNPGFAFVAILTLALGIGASAAVFTVVDAALMRPLPYREPERLAHLWESRPQAKLHPRSEASYPNFLDWRAESRSFESLAGYNLGGSRTITGGERPERLAGVRVTSNFFDVLGVEPALGRAFAAGEDAPGAAPVVVLGHGLWQRRFGGDPGVVGRAVTLDGVAHTVVGVLPERFHFARAGAAEIWVPLVAAGNAAERRRFRWVNVVGRLAPGATIEGAREEMTALMGRLGEAYPDANANAAVEVEPLRDALVGRVRPLLLVLFGAVALVLLIACANVANLLLARSAGRRREMAVRRAVGASGGRIARQLLVEGSVLALAGGLFGLFWAQWGVAALVAAVPAPVRAGMPYLQDLTVDARALGFTVAVALATGLLFSLAPALQAAGLDLHASLKERAAAGGGRERLRAALVVGEIALSLALLVGAGLLVQSLARLLATDPGFEPQRLLTFRVSLPEREYDEARAGALQTQLLERLEQLPGVSGAAATDVLPLSGGGGTGSFFVRGLPDEPADREHEANMRTVSPGYFSVMGIPLVSGRAFDDRDTADAPPRVVVNAALASRLSPGRDPVGLSVVFTFDPTRTPCEIVGVVGDENVTGLDASVTPIAYTTFLQTSDSAWSAVVRTAGDPEAMAAAVERELLALDPNLPAYAVVPMERLIADSPGTFIRRYPALLIGALAAVALALALVGIFGVVSYSVSQRTREIGVRVALGATARDVLALVLRQGATLVAAGVGLGVLVALAASRFLASLLFGVTATDPATYAAVAALLAGVTLLACYVPARRAARVDPIRALREE